jgi:hypothetical protein
LKYNMGKSILQRYWKQTKMNIKDADLRTGPIDNSC